MRSDPLFFDDLVGLVSAARLVAKAKGVSLAEASHFLEDALINDGTVIYTKVHGQQVQRLGEAWYAPACDYLGEALGGEWWNKPELIEQPIFPDNYLRDELAFTCIDAIRLLEIAPVNQPAVDEDNVKIAGPTHKRLQRAIAAFPARYPGYKERPPKLGDDVRVWLREVSIAANDREAHVFGAIIAEHFNLLGDTQKTP